MRRVLALLLVLAAAAAIVLAPPVDPGADPAVAPRPIRSAVLACPELAVPADSASTLAALVVPGTAEGSGAGQGQGTAALRRVDAELDLARVASPGEPLGLLVDDRSQPPIVLRADGAWAPGAVAGVATAERSGAGAGLSSAACVVPGPQWWFVGAGSQLGRGAALLVSNPAAEPARFDVSLHARSGPIEVLGGSGIDLGPQSWVRLRLDALAQPEDLLAVHLEVTGGRVAAALRDVAVPRSEASRGVDFLPPAVPPATELSIGAAPAGPGDRVLVLVNPGSQFATVTPQLVTDAGTAPIPDLPSIAVPAGSVASVPLTDALAGRPGTVLLRSDVPVTGALRAELPGLRRELSWVSAVPATQAPNGLAAAPAVLIGPDLTTTVTVTAPAGAASGTLQAWTTGTERAGILEAERGTPDRPGGGPELLTGAQAVGAPIRVEVPAGAMRSVVLPVAEASGLAQLVWRSDADAGPVVVSHVTRLADPAWQTGYAWWPTLSAVRAVPVREDVGTLAPPG